MQDADIMLITPQADMYYLPGGATVILSLYHVLAAGKTFTFSGLQTIRNLNFLRAGGSNVIATTDAPEPPPDDGRDEFN